jgi:hypothetical protein
MVATVGKIRTNIGIVPLDEGLVEIPAALVLSLTP